MLKPHVMQLPARRIQSNHRLRLAASPLTGANAAGFARRIMGQFGTGEDTLYPESWLVLREQEEREAQQQLQENQLTQLTLRLALQFSQNFLQQKNVTQVSAGMESPIRTLIQKQVPGLAQNRQSASASPMEQKVMLKTLQHYLTTLEHRDRETVREVRELLGFAEQMQRDEDKSRTKEKNLTLVQRLAQSAVYPADRERKILHRTMIQSSIGPERQVREVLHEVRKLAPSTGIGRISTAQQKAQQTHITQMEQRLEHRLEQVNRETERILERNLVQNSSPKAQAAAVLSKRHHPAGRDPLEEHKTRFLTMLNAADQEEQERIWALTTESTELAVRYQRSLEREDHLETKEKLTRLVRELDRREYTQLITMLSRELPRKEAAEGSPNSQPPEQKLLTQAAPVIRQIAEALSQKRILRSELLHEIQALPREAAAAYLNLVKDSKITVIAKVIKENHLTEEQQLEQLIRKAKRSELTQLTQHLTVLSQQVQKEQVSRQTVSRESTAMEHLHRLLTEEASQQHRAPLPFLEADEREALNQSAARLAIQTRLVPMKGDVPDFGDREPLVFLMEHSEDPVTVSRQLAQSEPIREVERQRAVEHSVLMRLEQFTQSRGAQHEEETRALLSGLDREGGMLLLKHLEAGQLIPTQADTPRSQPVQRMEELLTFRNQKEYKSFRYHLSEYLRLVETPRHQAGTELVRWAEEQKAARLLELNQTVETMIGSRPRAWDRALLPKAAPAIQTERVTDRELIFRAVTTKEGPVYERLTRLLTQSKPAPGILEEALPELKKTLEASAPAVSRLVREKSIELVHQTEKEMQIPVPDHQTRPTPRSLSILEAEPPVYRTMQAPMERLEPALAQIRQLAAQRAERITVTGAEPMPLTAQAADTIHTSLEQRRRLDRRRVEQLTERQLDTMETLHRELTAVHHSLEERTGSSYHRDHRELQTKHQITTTELQQLTREERKLTRELNRLTVEEYPKSELELATHPAARPAPEIIPRRHVRPAPELVQARQVKSRVERPDPTHWALPRAVRARKLQPALSALAPHTEETELRYEGRGEILELRREKPRQAPQVVEETAARSAELIVQKQAPQLQLLRRQDQEHSQQLEQQEQDMRDIREQLAQQEALVKRALEQKVPPKQDPMQVKTLARAVMKELEGQLRLERQRRGLS